MILLMLKLNVMIQMCLLDEDEYDTLDPFINQEANNPGYDMNLHSATPKDQEPLSRRIHHMSVQDILLNNYSLVFV